MLAPSQQQHWPEPDPLAVMAQGKIIHINIYIPINIHCRKCIILINSLSKLLSNLLNISNKNSLSFASIHIISFQIMLDKNLGTAILKENAEIRFV